MAASNSTCPSAAPLATVGRIIPDPDFCTTGAFTGDFTVRFDNATADEYTFTFLALERQTRQ